MAKENKITCMMVGHRYVNEVQTVMQVFFPFEKVEIQEGLSGGGQVVAGVDEDAAWAEVHVSDEGLPVKKTIPLTAPDIAAAGLGPRRVLMLAMFHALQEVKPTYAPWGALTGIRPSKMVRSWLEGGRGDGEIIRIMTDVLCCHQDKARLAVETAHAEMRLTEKIYHAAQGSAPPLGIYIGIPYCPSRCAYCSFNMNPKPPAKETLVQYADTLIRECREKEAEVRHLGGVVTSVYIGGGTPTVLPDDLLAKLLEAIHECFGMPSEYTVEAGRPDTLTAENVRLLRSHGVNRIAVNPQTLNDRTLVHIGRNHTASDFFRAFELARSAGFTCINTDIITGLPGEGPDDTVRTLEALLPLRPENITVHTLSLKRASRLVETQAHPHSMNRQTAPIESIVKAAGYAPYYMYRQKYTVNLLENVGYSLAGHECLYNIGMMAEVQTILGIGAGAVSKYVKGSKITRVFNEKNPEVYMNRRQK